MAKVFINGFPRESYRYELKPWARRALWIIGLSVYVASVLGWWLVVVQ